MGVHGCYLCPVDLVIWLDYILGYELWTYWTSEYLYICNCDIWMCLVVKAGLWDLALFWASGYLGKFEIEIVNEYMYVWA